MSMGKGCRFRARTRRLRILVVMNQT